MPALSNGCISPRMWLWREPAAGANFYKQECAQLWTVAHKIVKESWKIHTEHRPCLLWGCHWNWLSVSLRNLSPRSTPGTFLPETFCTFTNMSQTCSLPHPLHSSQLHLLSSALPLKSPDVNPLDYNYSHNKTFHLEENTLPECSPVVAVIFFKTWRANIVSTSLLLSILNQSFFLSCLKKPPIL